MTDTDIATRSPAPSRRRPRRPRWLLVALVAVLLRVGRDLGDNVAADRFGLIGLLGLVVAFFAVVIGWRVVQHQQTRRRGGEELTPEGIRSLLADSALGAPAFEEDGTLFGASLLAVCQRSKVLELNTAFDVFGSDGEVVARVRQIGQSRAKLVGRFLTSFDQFFTHHFDVVDPQGALLLRLTRPRKFWYTKVHVFDGYDRFLGTISQENVWGRIRFTLIDPWGNVIGRMRAEKLQAWDFEVVDVYDRPVASIVKAWEGWARTIFTRADRYSVRIHEPVGGLLRPLTIAAALAVDLGLKQDARGFG